MCPGFVLKASMSVLERMILGPWMSGPCAVTAERTDSGAVCCHVRNNYFQRKLIFV